MQMRSRMRVDGGISSYDGGTSRYGTPPQHGMALGQTGRYDKIINNLFYKKNPCSFPNDSN